MKLGHLGKRSRNNGTVLKCCAGKEWRRSFGPVV